MQWRHRDLFRNGRVGGMLDLQQAAGHGRQVVAGRRQTPSYTHWLLSGA